MGLAGTGGQIREERLGLARRQDHRLAGREAGVEAPEELDVQPRPVLLQRGHAIAPTARCP